MSLGFTRRNAQILDLVCKSILTFIGATTLSLPAQAQSTSIEGPSVKTVRGVAISPDAAKTYYTSSVGAGGWTYPSASEDYKAHLDSRLIELANSLGYDSVAWAALSGTDFETAKSDYVDAAYEYVRNYIEFTPMFGLQHGAMGAVYHGSGTAFDQANLLVELMKVAGITARYEIGTVEPTAAEFKAWFGTDVPKFACEILASGGIPATVNGSSDCSSLSGYASDPAISVKLAHAWVSIGVTSAYHHFDPAFKTYKYYNGTYDFVQKSGLTSAGVSGAIGGTNSSSGIVYTGPDPKQLSDYLIARSNALMTALETDNVATLSALGGRRMVVESGAPRLTSLPGHSASWLSAQPALPKELMAHVNIDLGMGSIQPSYTGNVTIPLSRIGADVVIVSPIDVTDGGLFSDGSGTFTAVNSLYELSILRPGSADHTINDNTGSRNGRSVGFDATNDTSGDNLLQITMSLQDTVNNDWVIVMDYRAPFAANNGTYGDRKARKTADKLTASTLVIQAGQNERFSGELYERYIPKKTNLWYGLYIDNSLQMQQCEQQRIGNIDSLVSGGGSSGIGGSSLYTVSPFSASCGGMSIPGGTGCLGIDCPIPGQTMEVNGQVCTVENSYIPVGFSGGTSMPSEGGGGVVTPTSACDFTPSNSIVRVVSHDKRLRTKAIVGAQWYRDASNYARLMGYLSDGQGLHQLSLGVVSASIAHNHDLSFGSDALLMDIDTNLAFAPASTTAKSLKAYGVATAAGLSATEGLILQNMTGAPRVDSAASKTDWFTWNASYNDVTGIHNGPYNPDSDPSDDAKNGNAVFEGFSPDDTVANVQSVAGDFAVSLQPLLDDGFYFIQPARADLGPVEFYEQEGPPLTGETYTYDGRKGRKKTYTTFKATSDEVIVSHIVGAGKKGGTGVTLPEFDFGELDGEELTKDSYDKLYGKFRVDEQSGNFSFTLENELVVGGQDHNQLSFSRTYESVNVNAGPLGQGWSHNHDAKIVVSTDLKTAYRSISPKQNVAAIIAGLASLELAETGLASDDWRVIPQTLLINGWMAHKLLDNQVVVTASSGSDTFYRLPSGAYANVDNPTAGLTQTGTVKFYEAVKPYVDDITKQELIELGNTDPSTANQTPIYHRRHWVVYEQYHDFSDVGFTYTTKGKTSMTFPRGQAVGTDAASLACFPNAVLPYRNAGHSADKCGKDAGRWSLSETTDVTGRKLTYAYTSGTLSSVTDERYGNALMFEYEANPGGVEFAPPESLGDDPTSPLAQLSASNLQPDSAVTHGQLFRLKRVYTNVASGPEVVFNYDTTQRYSPLMTSYQDAIGETHNYTYEALSVDQNNTKNEINLLKSFKPATLTTPTLTISYTDSGRVKAMTDANGRKSNYGINGGRNRFENGAGAETIRHYSPEGRLIEVIEPSYEGGQP